MLMLGQVDSTISATAKNQIAYLDLAVAISAVALTFAIVEGFSETMIRAIAWLFIAICLADLAIVQRFFVGEKFWDKEMGVFWLFQVLLSAPMLLGEFVVLYRLIAG